MSTIVSQGGRSLRNRADVDYTSCFYKNKLSRDEPHSQKSDEEPVLATRPRKKKQKLSQESETYTEDVDSDKQPSGDASEPLLDRTNKNQRKGGDARKRSKDATQRTSSRKGASPSTNVPSQEGRADENAGEPQQRASGSKQAGTDDGQPVRKRGKTSKKKKSTSKAETTSEQENATQSDPSRRSGGSQEQEQAQMENSQQQQHGPAVAVEQAAEPTREAEAADQQQVALGARNPRNPRASGVIEGSAEEVVDFLFRSDGPRRPAAQQNVAKVASMWDQTLRKRLDAAHTHNATLQAHIQALNATNSALEADARHHDDDMTATVEQFSKEKARILKNYQQLYAKFQEIRSRDRTDIMEVIESIWDAIEDHKNVAEKVAAAWKEEAVAQKGIVEECAAAETLERMQTLEEENLKLKAQVLDEGHMVMLGAQEINELKALVVTLRAGKPATADFGCSAAPETADAGCEAAPQTADVAVGLGKGTQWDGFMSPVAAARARRRTNLGVTRLACGMVPEGVDVNSLDTAVFRLGLIKPSDPSELASIAPMQQPMDLEDLAAEAEAPGIAIAAQQLPPAGDQDGSPLQQQVLAQQVAADDSSSHDVQIVSRDAAAAVESQVAADAVEQPSAAAAPEEDAAAVGGGGDVQGVRPARLSSTAAHAAVAAAHAMHRVTPPQLGSTTAHAAAAVNPALLLLPQRADSMQASNGPPSCPFDSAIAAASRVAAVADAAAAAAAVPAADGHEAQAEAPAKLPGPAAAAPAGRNRTSASTVEQGGHIAGPSNARRAAAPAAGTALRAYIGSPGCVAAPLRDSTRNIQSDPLPEAHKRSQPKPYNKLIHHRSLVQPPGNQHRRASAAHIPQQPPAIEAADAAPINVLPGRILSPVEEDKNAAPAGAPAAAPAAAAAQPLAAVAAAVAAAFVPPAAEHQAQQQQWVQGHGMLQDAHMTDAPELQVEGPIICSVGDVGMDAGDDAADGDVMSTSESDRAYGDADADTGPALILHSDAEGGIVHGGDQEEGRVADEEGQWPLVPDEFIEVDTSGAAGAGPSQQHMTVQQQRDLMPEQEDSGDREASRWAYSESMGRADSARTSNSLSKYAGFRDKMLGMELRLNRDGTQQWARHLASGFTFTVKQCTPLDPRIGHTSAEEPPDELTYVPHMELCPEHIAEALPTLWKESFDFEASQLHRFQQRIDQALEKVNPTL